MGMGEPLHNYDATIAATHILGDTAGLAISPSRMTLSTVGVVPGIIRLADDREPVSLAVSLHGATQEARAAMIPVAKAWPLDALMDACRYYCDTMDRHIFYEWTLIAGTNDRPEDAHALGELLRDASGAREPDSAQSHRRLRRSAHPPSRRQGVSGGAGRVPDSRARSASAEASTSLRAADNWRRHAQ